MLSCTEMSLEEADGPSTKRVVFKPTQPTPAYLVAWVVGSFEKVERTIMLPLYNNDPSLRASSRLTALTVRVFLRKQVKEQGRDGQYALDLACDCMSFFTRQFESNYPYSKV